MVNAVVSSHVISSAFYLPNDTVVDKVQILILLNMIALAQRLNVQLIIRLSVSLSYSKCKDYNYWLDLYFRGIYVTGLEMTVWLFTSCSGLILKFWHFFFNFNYIVCNSLQWYIGKEYDLKSIFSLDLCKTDHRINLYSLWTLITVKVG